MTIPTLEHRESKAILRKKKNEKGNNQATSSRLRDPPQWLEVFTDNLEDAEVPALANTSQDSDSERPAKVATMKHSIYTRFPKHRNCEIFERTKIARAPCRRRTGDAVPRAEKLVDLITADDEGNESRHKYRSSIVVQDVATQWIQPYQCKTKTSQKTEKILRKFLEPSE